MREMILSGDVGETDKPSRELDRLVSRVNLQTVPWTLPPFLLHGIQNTPNGIGLSRGQSVMHYTFIETTFVKDWSHSSQRFVKISGLSFFLIESIKSMVSPICAWRAATRVSFLLVIAAIAVPSSSQLSHCALQVFVV